MKLQELLDKHEASVQIENASRGHVWVGPFKNEADSHVFLAAISMDMVEDIPEQHYMVPTRNPSTKPSSCFVAILIGSKHPLYPQRNLVA